MKTETERKFLGTITDFIPAPTKFIPEYICQSYLTDFLDFRVRSSQNMLSLHKKWTMTLKTDLRPMTRKELEIDITEAQYNALLSQFSSDKKIRKLRYRDKGWDIDVYLGVLRGLVIGEYEYSKSENKYIIPRTPSFFSLVREVTIESQFRNRELANTTLGDLMGIAFVPPLDYDTNPYLQSIYEDWGV